MKATEIAKKSDAEIVELLAESRKELYEMRAKRLTEPVEDTSAPVRIRKIVARLLTEQQARKSKEQA